MATRTSYTPGTPSWPELTTPDQDQAKRFYTGLFGWSAEDNEIGGGAVYTMMSVDGHHVGAVSPQPAQQREADVSPMWNTYITAQSADETLKRAQSLGATVHAPAFDVMEAGRMGVVQDPQGAFFEVWEPKQHIGAGLVNAPGAFSWSELVSPDPDGSGEFYGELFGWKATPFEGMGSGYSTLANADEHTIGGLRLAGEDEPTYWLVYFGTDDVERSLSRAEELGGRRLTDLLDIGVGKVAALSDPQGAVFALYAGQFQD
jgi:uncharacterized protein